MISLEGKAEKTNNKLLSRDQTEGQIHDIKLANKSFENEAQVKCLWTTATNLNLIKK